MGYGRMGGTIMQTYSIHVRSEGVHSEFPSGVERHIRAERHSDRSACVAASAGDHCPLATD